MHWFRNLCWKLLGNAPAWRKSGRNALRAFLRQYNDNQRWQHLERDIQERFRLYSRRDQSKHSDGLPSGIQKDIEAARNNQQVASAFIFHGDGWVREAALNALSGPIELSVVAYGMLRRLNDWSGNVRCAAGGAVKRCFPCTPVGVLAPAIWLVLPQASSWRRWREGQFDATHRPDVSASADVYSALVELLTKHPTLLAVLVERLCVADARGTTAMFHALSRSAALDAHLVRIANDARQPHLRAIALGYLVSGRAIWPLGVTRKVWTNKALGEWRDEPDYGQRILTVEPCLIQILTTALADPATVVRRTALDALISRHSDERFSHLIREALSRFASDPWPSLRSRRDYLAKVIAAGRPSV